MAIEEIKKLVDASFNFVPRKIKKTIYVVSDGTEFKNYTVASDYDTKYFLMKEFKEYFSEEKNNFRLGTKELNNVLWDNEEEEDIYEDCFWVKIKNEQEKEFLKKFCKRAYKLKYRSLFYKENYFE